MVTRHIAIDGARPARLQHDPEADLVSIPRQLVHALLWSECQMRARLRSRAKLTTIDFEILQAACIAATNVRAALELSRRPS